ncbi:putative linoleate 9S-lipoxygenase 4 [Carex rostrata]
MMWFHGLCDCMTGKNKEAWKNGMIAGSVVLMKKNVLDFNDYHASLLDGVHELLGYSVSFQLVSSTHTDPATGKGKVGKAANLEEWMTTMSTVAAGESRFKIHFEWDHESEGIPGAVIVKNNHHSEFYLKTLTLEGVPGKGKGKVHFVCNSWIYPKYSYDRIFFTNETCLPSKMPQPLLPYRQQELINLRGDDVIGPLKESDRVYGYAVYNDLGDPDKGDDHVRTTLGGPEHPYPRRGRTGRPPTKTDPKCESKQPVLHSLDIYVPRDERFGHLKLSDFLAYNLKLIGQSIFPTLSAIFDLTPNEFDSFNDTFDLYDGGLSLPHPHMLEKMRQSIPFELFKETFRSEGHAFRLPTPHVLKEDKFAWRSDEEFGREMIAGVNPVIIRRLEEFPPTSNLDPTVYGNQTSTIKEEHILNNLDGFTVLKALKENKLYILDYHDAIMPYLPNINALKGTFIYATRTLLFLKDDGTIKPLAIELSLPHSDGLEHGAVSKVYTPASEGVDRSIWQLAKAYMAANDSGYHQLMSHLLKTHAVIEPFMIATNRQLSVTHPIHKLMSPHYRDTMNINALARQALISAGGIVENSVFPQKYALAMSSDVYKSWKFTEQGLPADLIMRYDI